jgi:hypothetical protein
MKRKLLWSFAAFIILVCSLGGIMLWSASGQLLFPVWRGVSKNLSVCPAEAERYWGKNCGNLKQSADLAALYRGTKTLWLPDYGGHGAIWDVDPKEYERRVSNFLTP